MKKLYMLVLFALLSVIVTACGSDSKGTENTKVDASAKSGEEKIPGNFTVAGGSVGGVWSVFTEGVAESVRREYPGTMIAGEPGTVAGNPVSIGQGKIDFGISESLTALFAYEGKEPFKEQYGDLRAVASIMPDNAFQLVAAKSAGFNTVEDIVNDKYPIRYSSGEKNALGDVVSAAVFEAYDVSYEDIDSSGGKVEFLSGGKTFELMADSRLDALGKMVPVPAGDIMEASATIDLKYIPIGEKAINHLIEKYSMIPFTVKADSYTFQEEDYLTVKSPTILIANANTSDEVVYQVTKAIYNQLEYLADVHNGFKSVNDETIIEVGKLPLHPGAEKFYKEKGLIK